MATSPDLSSVPSTGAAAPVRWPSRALRWLSPRPAEWVFLAWAAILGAIVSVRGLPTGKFDLPRTDIAMAALGVVAVKLALEYWRTPWPDPRSRMAMTFSALVILPAAISADLIFDQLSGVAADWPTVYLFGGKAGTIFNYLRILAGHLALALVPLLGWCGVGLHLKQEGRFRLGRLAAGAGVSALEYLRAFAPLMLVILSYSLVGDLLEKPAFSDKDGLMQAIDRALFFGRDPVQLLQAIINPWLSEWLALSYTSYAFLMPYLFAVMLAVRRLPALQEPAFALSLAFATGLLLYQLVPVQGPVFTGKFSVPLDLYYLSWVKEQLMDRFRVPRDCFPSLHTSITLLCLWQIFRNSRKAFWVALPISGPTPLACVYLRYHYVADVLAGALQALLVVALVGWLRRRGAFGERAEAARASEPAAPAPGLISAP